MAGLAHAIDIQVVSRLTGIASARQFRKWLRLALPKPASLTLRVVNAVEGRSLNSMFRGKDYATNVLTFVYHEKNSPSLFGDIVLCAPIVAAEARAQGISREAHYAHLTIHGALHLAGMDHELPRQARAMEKQETKLLASLGYSDPYLQN
jgi:probable rRNA maturation factor